MIKRRHIAIFAIFLPLTGICRPSVDFRRGVSDALHSILIRAKKDPAITALGEAVQEDTNCKVTLLELESELVQYVDNFRLLDKEELECALAEAVKKDFDTGDIVNVRGWRFSKLETIIALMSTSLYV